MVTGAGGQGGRRPAGGGPSEPPSRVSSLHQAIWQIDRPQRAEGLGRLEVVTAQSERARVLRAL